MKIGELRQLSSPQLEQIKRRYLKEIRWIREIFEERGWKPQP
jgi:hypothetical protein